MKNYPNQASTFARTRATLRIIEELNAAGMNPADDDALGYECVRQGVRTFQGLGTRPTKRELEDRIATERQKSSGDQSAQTFARELRRTLRDLGWIDSSAQLTTEGVAVLTSAENSVDEQALLVAGLLNIVVTQRGGTQPHHPVMVLLKLLAHSPSHRREGLELALEPNDDSEAEFRRVLALYSLDRSERMRATSAACR